MTPAFDTGKVRIGIAHIPKPMRIEGDALIVQKALLTPKTAKPLNVAERVLGKLVNWL